MSATPNRKLDYTNKDYEAFRTAMIEGLQERMPEYTDLSQTDAGIVILELTAMGLDILSYYQDVMANEAFLSTEEQRENAIKWCNILGYIPKVATPSKYKQVFVLSYPQQEDYIVPKGTVVKTDATLPEVPVYFETAEDLIIPAGKLGNEQSNGEYLYVVDVVQGITVNNEFLGDSNGSANQFFTLQYDSPLLESIHVYVNEGAGFEQWTRVDNFIDSAGSDKVYVVTYSDQDTATIMFGNNVFGKIPTPYSGGIFCEYRVGGGTQGNVSSNTIKVMDTNLADISSTFNPYTASEYGTDKETLEDIKIHAPNYFRTAWGALTLDDFSSVLKLNFPKVQFAIAEKDSEEVDNIFLYVLLKDNTPLTTEIKNEILDFFDENKGGRKIVGCGDIVVSSATLVSLDIACSLIVKDEYSRTNVVNNIKALLNNYFAIGNYDFHRDLSLSELASEVMNPANAIEGIKAFSITSVKNHVTGESLVSDGICSPSINEIYTLDVDNLIITSSGGVL